MELLNGNKIHLHPSAIPIREKVVYVMNFIDLNSEFNSIFCKCSSGWYPFSMECEVWTLQFIGQIKLNTLTNDYQHPALDHKSWTWTRAANAERKRNYWNAELKLIICMFTCVNEMRMNFIERKMILIWRERESVEKAIDKRLETVHRKRFCVTIYHKWYMVYDVQSNICTMYVLYHQ